MANKTKAQINKDAREYYHSHASYRKNKIKQREEYYHKNQKSQNAYERVRYRKDVNYRKYKIAYAKNYYRTHKHRK